MTKTWRSDQRSAPEVALDQQPLVVGVTSQREPVVALRKLAALVQPSETELAVEAPLQVVHCLEALEWRVVCPPLECERRP